MNSSATMLQPEGISAYARATAPISLATVNGTMALYIILCTIVTIGRMFARYAVHQRLWWDDWTMVIAWLGLIGLCVQQLIMAQHGGGVNYDLVPKSEYKKFADTFSDLEIVARLAIFFAKVSILLLYIRVFFPPRSAKTAFYWVIHAVIWLNLLYTIALVLVVTLQCVPEGLPEGSTCVNEALVLIMASVINIISDIAVLLIPLGAVWRLQLSEKKKWGLFALFGFGALAPLASIGRLAYQIPEAAGHDKTVIYMIVSILATAEQAIAIIVGSVPVASAWFLKQQRRGSDDMQRRTFTDRMKPSRESDGSGGSKRSKAIARSQYHITDVDEMDKNDSTENMAVESWQMQAPTAIVQATPKDRVVNAHNRRQQHHYTSYGRNGGLPGEDIVPEDSRVYGIATTTVQIETRPREWPQ